MPTLGHLPVTMITAGLVDRAIDEWEKDYGRSTVKNTVSALVLVLDEAVRDGIIVRNPAKDRARRKTVGRSFGDADHEPPSPRERPHGRLVVVGHRGDVVPAITHPPVHSHRQPRAHLHGVLDAPDGRAPRLRRNPPAPTSAPPRPTTTPRATASPHIAQQPEPTNRCNRPKLTAWKSTPSRCSENAGTGRPHR